MTVSSFSGIGGWIAFVSWISFTPLCKTHPEMRSLGIHTRIQLSRASSHLTTSPLVNGPKVWDFLFGSTETKQASTTTPRLVSLSAGKRFCFSGEGSCRSGFLFFGAALKAEQPKIKRHVGMSRTDQEKSTREGRVKLQPRARMGCGYRERSQREKSRSTPGGQTRDPRTDYEQRLPCGTAVN
jgi:hypothetical protein